MRMLEPNSCSRLQLWQSQHKRNQTRSRMRGTRRRGKMLLRLRVYSTLAPARWLVYIREFIRRRGTRNQRRDGHEICVKWRQYRCVLLYLTGRGTCWIYRLLDWETEFVTLSRTFPDRVAPLRTRILSLK